MEQQRTLLLIALFVVMFLIWDAWQRDYAVPRSPAVSSQTPSQATPAYDEVPLATDTPVVTATDASAGVPAARRDLVAGTQRVRVTTDLFDIELDTRGADLRRVDLLQYPVEVTDRDNPLRLMDDEPPRVFIAQGGFAAKRQSDSSILISAPNHNTVYQAAANRFELADGSNELVVPFRWTSPDGVHFIKEYRFKRDSYLIDVVYHIDNPTEKAWQGNLYNQLQRMPLPDSDSQMFIYTYTGGIIYSDEDKYQKISFSDMQSKNLDREIQGGWTAMIQHYFLAAWVPSRDERFRYYSRATDNERYILGMTSPAYQVAAGERRALQASLFVGPKLQDELEVIAPGLELTVDYGMLTFIAKPIFWLLRKIHNVVGNWGWSIIFLTLIIKLVFYKLSETSYKSMANMRRVQPRMKALKDRYGDDRAQMNKALMDLYKKEKINPLGGCFPILIQIPVFIALYWVLLESVELRQAPFMLWIQDMSTADPYFVLPILMGVTMVVQQKLNPTPLDPIQAKMMMILPLVFTVFFAFFPAGLVLYWVVNNILSIAQQWYITRKIVDKAK
ncbi:MAG: membrane protein insertase YidC [Gammaproteobacteria bacterium]